MKKVFLKKGFGLIEIMVSIAIFAFVVTAGLGAVLAIVDANQKSQSLNSVMSNLNSALEDMARNIRTGFNYTPAGSLCGTNGSTGIQFTPQASTEDTKYYIYKLVGNRITVANSVDPSKVEPTTAPEVQIDGLCFYFYGAGQPKVVMTLKGHVKTKASTASYFYLQTTMSQRLLPTEAPAAEF